MYRKYNEQKLSQYFNEGLITKINSSIDSGRSINLVSSQGVGTSLFFKYFITHTSYKTVYVDCDHLPEITPEDFYQLFLQKLGVEKEIQTKKEFLRLAEDKIREIITNEEPFIILLAHFDQLKKFFTKDFFDVIKYLRSIHSGKIIFVLNTYVPLTELLQNKLLTINTNLFAQTYYVTPYNRADLKEIAEHILFLDTEDDWIRKAMHLSGGSYYLLSLLARTERIENPLKDPFVKMYFKRMMESFTLKRRKTIERIGLGKETGEIDDFLIQTGIVKKTDQGYQLFTPLFEEYVRKSSSLKLSIGEKKLFRLLKSKIGKVVDKDEIFEYVWGEDNDASDWALNSMIYRIRNNPVFREQGYEIENFKKEGYRLTKH